MQQVLRITEVMDANLSITVQAERYHNATVVIITIDDGTRLTNENRAFRIRGGLALCHPRDEYDFLEGVKQACKNALEIKEHQFYLRERNPKKYEFERCLYSTIRATLSTAKVHKAEGISEQN